MSKQVTTSKQTTDQSYTGSADHTNTYDFLQAPINAQTQGVIDAANAPIGSDPGLHSRYARAREDVQRSYLDPQGAYTTPFVRGKAELGALMKIGAQEDQAKREDYYNQQQQGFGRKLAAANLTNPQLVNTGGTSTQSGSSTGTSNGQASAGKNLFGDLLDIGLGAAA